MIKVNKIEEKVLIWLRKKRFKVYLFILATILLWILPLTPYINIFVNYSLSIFFIFALLILIFNISFRIVVVAICFLFLFCLFYQLLGQVERSDFLANYIYGILFLEVVLYLLSDYGQKE